MSAGTRIIPQVDNFGIFRDLLDFAKDPKAISKVGEIHDEMRKQQALTDEQAKKAAEAKDFIAKYAVLQKDLKVAQDKFTADKAAHEKDRSDQELVIQKEIERLTAKGKELDKIGAAHIETASAQLAERKKLDADKKAQQDEFNQMLKKLTDKAAVDDKLRAANENEAARLAGIKQKLDLQAARVKEALAS